MKKILVAGASGKLGQIVVRSLKNEGHWVRVISRTKERWDHVRIPADDIASVDLLKPSSLEQCCDSVDAVISCAGASMDIKRITDRATFTAVDFLGNKYLLDASKRSQVKKFVYVSVAGAEMFPKSEYCSAHVRFEQELHRSGMDHAVVKPTGFFYFFGEMMTMAKKGRGIIFGDGIAKTNPIHEEDAAQACIDGLNGSAREIIAGGPEVFSRKEIVELAFSVAGRTPSITSVPPRLFIAATYPMKFINPRIHALLEFGAAVSTSDSVVERYGKRKLSDYFQSIK